MECTLRPSIEMNRERHYVEVVRTAVSGGGKRAVDLLRGRLAGVGCDPVAFQIIAQFRSPAEMDDDLEHLARQLPECHPTRWPSWSS
jgi:hypothetical protein